MCLLIDSNTYTERRENARERKEKKNEEKSRLDFIHDMYGGPVEVLRFQIFSSKLQLQ